DVVSVDRLGVRGEVGEEGCEGEALAVGRQSGGGEGPRVEVVGDGLPRARPGGGEGRDAAAGAEIEDASPGDPRGTVEDDAGEGGAAGPGVGPVRRREGPPGEPLGRLPDLDQPPGVEHADLWGQRRGSEIRVAVEELGERGVARHGHGLARWTVRWPGRRRGRRPRRRLVRPPARRSVVSWRKRIPGRCTRSHRGRARSRSPYAYRSDPACCGGGRATASTPSRRARAASTGAR